MEKYYRHFKGNLYRVLHIAKHTETLEDMVVYQAMYGDRDIWVRPKAMFEEEIERDGKTFRPFEPITEADIMSADKYAVTQYFNNERVGKITHPYGIKSLCVNKLDGAHYVTACTASLCRSPFTPHR